jgi:phosphatidylinositol-3-phosphatase
MQRGQRYCLACGERCGSRSPQLAELLRRVRERGQPDGEQAEHGAGSPARPASSAPIAPATWLAARVAALPVPSPRISALLVFAFLGFGVLLGNVAGSRVDSTLAASARRQVKLVLPPPSAAAATTTESESAAGEPPSTSVEPTPEAAAPVTPAPTKAPAASSGRSSPSSADGVAGGKTGSQTPASAGSGSKLPAVKHVFVIMLSNQPYASVFGPSSSAPYLSHTLERKGELLVRYYAVAHEQLANGIALLSGQGPTPATAANCPVYADLAPTVTAGRQQVLGDGCVYPPTTETLAGQLSAKHLSWRAYVQGIDEAGGTVGACGHPAIGAPDPTSAPTPTGQPYATFRNPFVYFHSLIDSPACAVNDVGLSSLSADLENPKRTPSLSYIVPDRCHDGDSTPCASGAPAGLPAADGFLRQVVPKILGSKAYKDGGLLAITVDEAPSGGELGDSSSCCGQPQFPNLPAPGGPVAGLPPNGGGQVGALLLSPFVKPGSTNQEPYNHYSLLRTIEDMFSLRHLGYAGLAHVNSLEPSVFSPSR